MLLDNQLDAIQILISIVAHQLDIVEIQQIIASVKAAKITDKVEVKLDKRENAVEESPNFKLLPLPFSFFENALLLIALQL